MPVKRKPAKKKVIKRKPAVRRPKRKQTGKGAVGDAYNFVNNNKLKILKGIALGALTVGAAGAGAIKYRQSASFANPAILKNYNPNALANFDYSKLLVKA
jgi:hypothetical protein